MGKAWMLCRRRLKEAPEALGQSELVCGLSFWDKGLASTRLL